MSEILLTGDEGGLGKAIKRALAADHHSVIGYDKRHGFDVRSPDHRLLDRLRISILINCAGCNLIDWLEDVSEVDWNQIMDTNAKGIYEMTQAVLPQLIDSQGTVVNIVSNAAHVPMTCSLAYNASKAAAAMMTRQLARELTPKYGITVFSVSPNKLAGTAMSESIDKQVCETRGWTYEQAREYQMKSLLCGEETPVKPVAELIAYLLRAKENHKYLSGCDIPYGV